MAAVLASCAGSTTPTPHTSSIVADYVEADSPVSSMDTVPVMTEVEPPLPPMKSSAELGRLQAQWAAAHAAERTFLMSSRLQRWLKELKATMDPNDPSVRPQLTDDQFGALSVKEMLAYQMYYPEDWSQLCLFSNTYAGRAAGIARALPQENMVYIVDSGKLEYLPADSNMTLEALDIVPFASGYHWSDRQLEALRKDSVAVKRLVLECLATHGQVSIAMMRTIANFKIKEAILPLMDIYRRQAVKDELILTTIMEIMERSNYWKWIYSPVCKSVVAAPYEVIPLTQTNLDEIFKHAQTFAEQ
jgi:hypothetical protein